MNSGLPREGEPGGSGAGEPGRRARAPFGGPYLLLFPLVFALVAVWWIRRPESSALPNRPPDRADPEATHEVLGGELSLGGAILSFWLAPYDPDHQRQAFQAAALRLRYGLEEGEPWRLRLEWRPVAGERGAEGPTELQVSALSVEDDAGRALAPLRLARELDPLATLLAPPVDPLVPGRGVDLCLWGRAPRTGARLAGLPGEDAGAATVALAPRPLRQGDLVGPMARLDPSAPAPVASGKKPARDASATPVRGADDARY